MTAGRKRWWRMVAVGAVGGGVVAAGAWLGFVRATAQPPQAEREAINWTRAAPPAVPAPLPAVAEEPRAPEPAALPLPLPIPQPISQPGAITPVGGTLPIPVLDGGTPVSPVVPAAPVPVPPVPGDVLPATGPRAPDSALIGDKSALPQVPALPALPTAEIPAAPKLPDAKPGPSSDAPPAEIPTPPVPELPAPPASSAEPPKANPQPVLAPPPTPAIPPMPAVPPTPGITPSLPPANPAEAAPPVPPAKSDSDLNPTLPGNTLNPGAPPVAPAVPVAPAPASLGIGSDAPAKPLDRPKPPEPDFANSEKFVFPIPARPNPLDSHHRDDAMYKLTTTAAFAVLGGALLAAEQASALPAVPAPSRIPVPGTLVKAETEVEKLTKDLEKANKKIEQLEKDVAKLTDLLNGKKDASGDLVNPKAPGAVEEVKRLNDKIANLEDQIKTLKSQTSLKPSVSVPEAKSTGIVKVINEYPVEISIVVNDKSYRVAPNKVLDVEVAAGDFTYQLLQSGAPATKSVIRDKETVRLRIK